ncbi:cobalamin biosynthesis protein CobT, partial [Thiorhodovibrio frisius]
MSHAFRTLHQAMPIVAAALGRKFGVPVAVGGDEACTDGNSIQVPALPPQSELIPVAWGYLAHEAAHLRFTDFETYRQGASGSDPLTRSLLNILEDIRIERAIAAPYPGTRENLQAVCDHLSGRGALSPPKPDAHPAHVLTSYLLLHLRHRLLETASLAVSAHEAERVLRQVFPARTVHRLQGLLAEVGQLASTADAVDLAQRIRALLEEEKQSARAPSSGAGSASGQPDRNGQERPDESGQNATGTGGTDNQMPGGSVGAPLPADEQAAQGPTDPTAGQTSSGTPAGSPSGQGGGQDGGTPAGHNDPGSSTKPDSSTPSTSIPDAPHDALKTQAVSQTLNASDDDLPGDLFQQVRELLDAAGQGDSPCLLPRAEPFDGDPARGLRLLGVVQEESRRLRARLQGLVQASRLDRPQAFRHGPRLLPKRLYRAAVGDPRL